MEIRGFEGRDDAEGIVRVEGRAWREAYAGLLPEELLASKPVDPEAADVDRLTEALGENEAGVLVAVEEGRVLGYADVRWGDAETKPFIGDGEAGLKAIYVDPDHWGEGIGTALLEAAIDLLPTSVDALGLEALAGNEVGRRFYEARGFERTGSSEFEIGGDTYETEVYTLRLPASR